MENRKRVLSIFAAMLPDLILAANLLFVVGIYSSGVVFFLEEAQVRDTLSILCLLKLDKHR